MDATAQPLARAVRDLRACSRAAPSHRGRYDGGAGLGRAASDAAASLKWLAASLRAVEMGRATTSPAVGGAFLGAERKRNRSDGAAGDHVEGSDGEDSGDGDLGEGLGLRDLRRAGDLFALTGPWLRWCDRRRLFDAVRPSLGIPRLLDPLTGIGAAHVADVLYREGRDDGMGLEDVELKLNYPTACSLTVEGDCTGEGALQALRSMDDAERGRWSVAVVGLRGHGKSALCGRLARGLAGCSNSALFRTRCGAGRSEGSPAVPGPGDGPNTAKVRDAVWTMDRDSNSRRMGSSTEAAMFPVLCDHQDCRSFVLWDLPPFMDKDLACSGFRPSLETRQRKALGVLQCARVTTLVVVVAADMTFQREALASLLSQAVAACRQHLQRIVFAITKMDRVFWNIQSYQAAVGRVEEACDGLLRNDGAFDVVCIPTSAADGQMGICASCTPRTKDWGTSLTIDSVFSALWLGKTLATSSSGPPVCVIYRLWKTETHRDDIVYVVISTFVLNGAVKVGDKVEMYFDRQPCRAVVREVQWFHLQIEAAYAGMVVGLKLEPIVTNWKLPLSNNSGLHPGDILRGEDTSSMWTKKHATFRLRRLHKGLKNRKDGHMRVLCHMKMLNLNVDSVALLPKLPDHSEAKLVQVEVTLHVHQANGVFWGESVLLYQGGKLYAFGYVAAVGDNSVVEDRERDIHLSVELPPIPPNPVVEALMPPRPHPHGRLATDRGVSTGSYWSTVTGVSSSAGKFTDSAAKLEVCPAKTLQETIQQADAVIESAMRLKGQLQRAVAAVAASPYDDETELLKCYSCLSLCLRQPNPGFVPVCQDCQLQNDRKRTAQLGLDRTPPECAWIVTGARIKIGGAIVRRLLGDGARLLVLTTRFPYLLAEQLVEERPPGFEQATIHIYGADFRCVPAVVSLGSHLSRHYPKVYALLNNAAQTVRRPSLFYTSLVERELDLAEETASAEARRIVKEVGKNPFLDPEDATEVADASYRATRPTVSPSALISAKNELKGRITAEGRELAKEGDGLTMDKCLSYPRVASCLMTQCAVMDEDRLALSDTDLQLFPRKDLSVAVDSHTGELVEDLRSQTSWTKSLLPSETESETVQPAECLEVLLVNTLAPFILLKALCGPLQAARGNVVNVTSREGETARVKQAMHPHTNMSKAGLNMLTRTAAMELQKVGVAVCSVDPGWISNTQPVGKGLGGRKVPPLTLEDGASRVLDPIRQRLDGKRVRSGVLWRDFRVVPLKE